MLQFLFGPVLLSEVATDCVDGDPDLEFLGEEVLNLVKISVRLRFQEQEDRLDHI